MARLNLQDFAFLQVETAECPAHVAGLQIFQLPKNDKGRFFRDLMDRIDLTIPPSPPFNQKLKSPSISMDMLPSWVEDKNFDLDYHVRYSALPAPGTMDQLMKLVERLHSRLLDRTRPLWECYFIEGLEGNRVALYFKIHHACMDGVAAMSILSRVMSTTPNAKNVTGIWQAGSPKPKHEVAAANLTDKLIRSYAGIRDQARSIQQLSGTVIKSGLQALSGTNRKSPRPFTAPATPFNAAITQHRRFAVHTIPLSRIKGMARDLNMTVNDIVLAICAGAIRRYLLDHNALPAKPVLAMCPVSVRPKDGEQRGNQISMIVTTLATEEADTITRLKRIHDSASEAKHNLGELTRESATNYALLMNGALLVSNATGLGDRVSPPANLVISNVPGPREKLYLMGAELIHNYPMSVLVHGQALNITVTSYADELDFGLLAAREAMPDLDNMAAYIGQACDELEVADEAHLARQAEAAHEKLLQRRVGKPVAAAPRKPNVAAKPRKTAKSATDQSSKKA
tara:strand:- start:4241 stop:5779 length:1539 start_codon:yes stop_codon:yes gene_type:complete